jgi:hypothetical protein
VNVCRNESAGLVGMEINESRKSLKTLERVKGIEPSYSAWKAAALPLSYTRVRPINYHAMEAASTAMRGPMKPPWFLQCFAQAGLNRR